MKKENKQFKQCNEDFCHGIWTRRDLDSSGMVYIHLKTGCGNYIEGFDEATKAFLKTLEKHELN